MKTGPLTIAELIAHEDKLYFDKKANSAAFMKGFVLGSASVIIAFVIISAAGLLFFNWALTGLHG